MIKSNESVRKQFQQELQPSHEYRLYMDLHFYLHTLIENVMSFHRWDGNSVNHHMDIDYKWISIFSGMTICVEQTKRLMLTLKFMIIAYEWLRNPTRFSAFNGLLEIPEMIFNRL